MIFFSMDLHMGSPVHMHSPEPDTLRVDVVNGWPFKQNYNCAHGYVTVASIKNYANFFAREEDRMTSVDSNFNFLCGRPHGAWPRRLNGRSQHAAILLKPNWTIIAQSVQRGVGYTKMAANPKHSRFGVESTWKNAAYGCTQRKKTADISLHK